MFGFFQAVMLSFNHNLYICYRQRKPHRYSAPGHCLARQRFSRLGCHPAQFKGARDVLDFLEPPPVLGRTGLDRIKPIFNRLAVHSAFSLMDSTFTCVATRTTRPVARTTRLAAHRGHQIEPANVLISQNSS